VGGEGDTSDVDVDEVMKEVKAKAQEPGDDDHSANDSVDAYCWSKVVSDGQVDLLGLLVPMKFGKWNPRPVHQKDNKLAQSMFMSAMKTFRPGTLIANECLTDAMTSAAAKPLQPSEMGHDMSALRVSGGRHRYEALEFCKVSAKKEITKYEEVFVQETDLSDEDIAQRRQARKEIVDCGSKQVTGADVNSKLHACIRSTSTTYLIQADRDPAANLSRQSTDAILEDDDNMPALMQVTEDPDDEDLIEKLTGNVYFRIYQGQTSFFRIIDFLSLGCL
jgi:hypothetical protein